MAGKDIRRSGAATRKRVLDAALIEFGRSGLHGTATEAIARRTGVTQPYLFKLFGTKKKLFMAAVAHAFQRVREACTEASAGLIRDEALGGMASAYRRLLIDDPALLMVQMHAYSACDDPEIRVLVRREFVALYRFVEQASDATPADVRTFFATGMLVNTAAVMQLPARHGAWANSFVRRRKR